MPRQQHEVALQWTLFALLAVVDAVLLFKLFGDAANVALLTAGVTVVSALLLVSVRIFDLGSLSVGEGGMKADLKTVEVKVGEIQDRQNTQELYLDAFFRILSDRLTLPMKHHLRVLAAGGEQYKGQEGLRQELLQLKRFGLIEEVPPQKIGAFLDGKDANVASFVRLTPTGKKFIMALDKIETQ
jgi:hypothetical protein